MRMKKFFAALVLCLGFMAAERAEAASGHYVNGVEGMGRIAEFVLELEG